MKHPKKKTIGVDFDDVLMNFNDTLMHFHNARYGTSLIREHCTDFDLSNIWKCSPEENVRRILEFYETDMHWDAQPVEKSQEAVEALSRNHNLVVITSRPESIRKKTLHWLEKHFPKVFDHIIFTNQFSGKTNVIKKSHACTKLGVEIFIDDHDKHALDIAHAGIDSLLFDTPWNQSAPKHPKITRVYGWKDILEKLSNPESQILNS